MNIYEIWGKTIDSGAPNILKGIYSFGDTKTLIIVPTNMPATMDRAEAKALIHKSFIEMLKSGRDVKIVALEQASIDENITAAGFVFTLAQTMPESDILFTGVNAYTGGSVAIAPVSVAPVSVISPDCLNIILEFAE